MNELRQFQHTVTRALIGLSIVHVPAIALLCSWLGRPVAAATAACLALAAVPALLLWARRPLGIVGAALTIALIAQVSLLVYAFGGHPWQVEMHFYYFVVLAMLSGLVNTGVLVLAAGLIAVHHIGLNYFMPLALFSGGTDVTRVFVHAAFVAIELTMLIFLIRRMAAAFLASEQALVSAEGAAAELKRIGEVREKELVATQQRTDRLSELLDTFKAEMEQSIEALNKSAGAFAQSADSLSTNADQAKVQVQAASSASEETTAKVTTVANAGNELARTISDISTAMAASSRLAADVVARADTAGQTIAELKSAAHEIGHITGLINQIAGQTNLLSLNATIEAARAGEAGRGFSVVAQEVKSLAAATAQATQNIAGKVTGIQNTTEQSAIAIEAILGMVHELNQLAGKTAGAIDQQASATHEIALNVEAAATGASHVAHSIGKIETMADGTVAATTDLRQAAADLSAQTQTIRMRIAGFTNEVLLTEACNGGRRSA